MLAFESDNPGAWLVSFNTCSLDCNIKVNGRYRCTVTSPSTLPQVLASSSLNGNRRFWAQSAISMTLRMVASLGRHSRRITTLTASKLGTLGYEKSFACCQDPRVRKYRCGYLSWLDISLVHHGLMMMHCWHWCVGSCTLLVNIALIWASWVRVAVTSVSRDDT